MTKDTREAFEKWYSKEFSHVWHSQIGAEDTNHYEAQFDCWQAATSAAEAEIESLRADLAVAVEALEESKIQINNFGCDGSHIKMGCDACVFQMQLDGLIERFTNNVAVKE
jgi:hypothetical protein